MGTSDFVLRFFSAIWILFGAITSYIILYKHHYKSLALLYIIFFLLAPQTIYYAQECRNYAMLLCLTSIFCTLLYLVLESMHDRLKLTHQFWYFLGILLCGTALVLTHYYAYVFVFCVGVVFLLQSILTRKFFIPLFICFGLMGLAGIIWISIHHFYGGFLDRMDTAWVFEYACGGYFLALFYLALENLLGFSLLVAYFLLLDIVVLLLIDNMHHFYIL